LSSASGATIATGTATGTIVNDDLAAAQVLNFDGQKTASYTDSAGNAVTIVLKGPGIGTITFAHGGKDADTISVSGTTGKSTLTIKSKRATSVRKIVDTAAIGSIDAHVVNLSSAFSAPVSGKVLLGSVNGATITLAGAGTATTFSAGNVSGSTLQAA